MKLSGLPDLSVASICGSRVSRGVRAFEPHQCGRFQVHFPEGPSRVPSRQRSSSCPGTAPYNMIKDEQLPKTCHEEQYRCSSLLKPHRPMVKIKEETYAKKQGVQAPPEHTKTKKSRFGLTKGAGQCFIFWNGMCVGRQVVGRDGLFLGSSLGPSSS